jgi:hypothetical protein
MEDINNPNQQIPTVEVESQPQVASDLVQAQPEPSIVQEEMEVEQDIKEEAPKKLRKMEAIDPERIKNLERNGLSRAAAEMYIIKEEKRKMELNAQKEAEQEQAQSQEMMTGLQDLDQEAASIKEAIQDAEEVGIDASNLRKRLEEIESEKETITASQGFKPFPTETLEGQEFKNGQFQDPSNPNAPADRQDVMQANADANQVTQQEVDQKADSIKQEHIKLQAEEQVAQDEIARQRKTVEDAQNKLAEEDLQLGKIDPDRFWKNKSTGSKILAAIGMMLGGAPAVGIVQQQIKNDIDAQNLTNKQSLAKRAQAIKLVNTQIDRLSALTNDKFKQEKLQLSKQQLGIQLEKINMDRLKLAQNEIKKKQLQKDISQGKLKDPTLLNKEDRDRVVRMRDGSIQLADNKKASEAVRKFQAEVEPAIKGAHRILKISEEGSRLNLKDRARIATDLKALVGQLRIPFTGPGVLTDTEYERLLDTIGDPNKLFAIPEIERTKIKTVIQKLTGDLDIRYKQAGLKGVKNKREQLIDLKLQQKAGSREQVEKSIDRLIEQGKLSTDYEIGF